MRLIALCAFALSLLLISDPAAGQSTPIHEQIEQTYNFQPHLLNSREIAQKSSVLSVQPNFKGFIPQYALTLGKITY